MKKVIKYHRSLDFNRDAWYDLVKKSENKKYRKYRKIIEIKIEEKISKGRCTIQQVDELRQKVQRQNRKMTKN